MYSPFIGLYTTQTSRLPLLHPHPCSALHLYLKAKLQGEIKVTAQGSIRHTEPLDLVLDVPESAQVPLAFMSVLKNNVFLSSPLLDSLSWISVHTLHTIIVNEYMCKM